MPIGRYLKALKRRRSQQRDYRRLLQLSDHHLRDVGLTRRDVEHMLSKPLD